MKISQNGLSSLIKEEGFKTKAYQDIYKKWTIGVGHLIVLPKEKALITKILTFQEVNDLLKKDVVIYEECVNNSIKIPLKQNQFDACVSMAFNIGIGGFSGSQLVKDINSFKNSINNIHTDFMSWYSHGDLTARREREAKMFNEGVYF